LRIRCPDASPGNRPGDGSLVIDRRTGAVANVFTWVRGEVDHVHPQYRFSASDPVTICFRGDRIQPRAAVFRTGQSLVFQSRHSETHSPVFDLAGLSSLLQPDATMPVPFSGRRAIPQEIRCAIHPEARAFLMIVDHPYAGITDTNGSVFLSNLPVGEHELRFYHERVGYLDLRKADQQDPATAKGLLKITVKEGMNDLGEFVVPRAEFN
jgi:hypothetical protein